MSESELELSARLLRALSHRLRGDLSVITNDLVYLSSLVDPAELDRPRARCASIASSLASLGLLSAPSRRERSTLETLSEVFGLTLDRTIDPSASVAIDAALVRQTSQLLRQLLGPWTGSVMPTDEARGLAACVLRFDQPRSINKNYPSLGCMAAAELGESFVVEACLIDLVVRDHNWVLDVVHDGERLVCVITVMKQSERG